MTFQKELKQINIEDIDYVENIKEYCRMHRKSGYSMATINRNNPIFFPECAYSYDEILYNLTKIGLSVKEIHLVGKIFINIRLIY